MTGFECVKSQPWAELVIRAFSRAGLGPCSAGGIFSRDHLVHSTKMIRHQNMLRLHRKKGVRALNGNIHSCQKPLKL